MYINVESPCNTSETYNIVCQLYFNKKKKEGKNAEMYNIYL